MLNYPYRVIANRTWYSFDDYEKNKWKLSNIVLVPYRTWFLYLVINSVSCKQRNKRINRIRETNKYTDRILINSVPGQAKNFYRINYLISFLFPPSKQDDLLKFYVNALTIVLISHKASSKVICQKGDTVLIEQFNFVPCIHC